MAKNIGLLGIPPRQINDNTREFETDDGEGTTLCITPTETALALQILQYDADKKVTTKSAVWRIVTADIEIGIVLYHSSRWGLKGINGIVLDIERAGDGDMRFAIHDPSKRELPSRVPQFSQVVSGGKSKHIMDAIKLFVDTLPESIHTTMITPYVIIERIYEAIALEKDFVMVS